MNINNQSNFSSPLTCGVANVARVNFRGICKRPLVTRVPTEAWSSFGCSSRRRVRDWGPMVLLMPLLLLAYCGA